MISYIFYKFVQIVFLILFVTILLTWFPGINWNNEPVKTLKRITDMLLSPFRFIPPIGMIDISPIVAFFVYGIIANLILRFLLFLHL